MQGWRKEVPDGHLLISGREAPPGQKPLKGEIPILLIDPLGQISLANMHIVIP